jgi:hypothetical protein
MKPHSILRLTFALLAFLAVTASFGGRATANEHVCASDARNRAKALIHFHLPDIGHPVGIGEKVETLPPLPNPAASGQIFDVLQLWADVYKARYRVRFIYARLPGSCLLMGQEILEYARL